MRQKPAPRAHGDAGPGSASSHKGVGSFLAMSDHSSALQHHVAGPGSRALDAQSPLPPLQVQVKAIAVCPSGGMVDTTDSKSVAARRAGSSPASGTIYYILGNVLTFMSSINIMRLYLFYTNIQVTSFPCLKI